MPIAESATSPARAPSETAIEVDGLECSYGGVDILKDVTFKVGRGESVFIIGPSGCGKTTLLRNIVGLNRPRNGTVKFLGQLFSSADVAARRLLLRNFGMLFQSGALWTSMTLRQNVSLPLEEHTSLTRNQIEEIANLKLAQVGLGGFEDYSPPEIRGGMKKRAGLARALALDPAIVFFDEPWAGLDPITSRKLNALIRQIRDTFGTTLVIVSHELGPIFSIADRVIMLDRDARGIIAQGPPRQLAESSTDERVKEFLNREVNTT
jgi:phospholipid/cholesterol/gamma-HCH transport system ATP-binding protein